jgi:hypothetical protein
MKYPRIVGQRKMSISPWVILVEECSSFRTATLMFIIASLKTLTSVSWRRWKTD